MVSEMEDGPGRPAGEAAGDGALPALPVIHRFGGIRPMAQKLGVPVSTVQGWKERGAIPANRREEVLAAAERHGIRLEPGDLSPAPAHPPIVMTDDTDAPPIAETADSAAPAAGEPPADAWEEHREGAAGLAAAEEAAPFPPPETASLAAPRAAAGSALLPAMLAAAVVALAISASAPWWTRAIGLAPRSQPFVAGDTAEAMRALERRIAELESRPPAPAASASEPGELVRRLEALEEADAGLREALDRLSAASPSGEGGAPAPDLQQRLDAVAADLAGVKEQLQGVREGVQAGAPERLSALSDRIEENAAELRAMQTELSRLVELPKRVQDLGEAIAAASGQAERTAFVLASGQLEAALDSGQPYASELGAVRRLAAEDTELPGILAQLEQHSDEGIPSLAELRPRFDDMALAAAQAAQSEVEGGWMDRAWARLRSLVTVRPVGGDVTGDSPEAHLARAEARLDDGDLGGAVGEIEVLEGPAGEAAAPWLAGARARLAADQAIEALRKKALARVLPNGSGG